MTFKKSTSIQEAKDIIDTLGMRVLKVYKGISESTGKPMLHIGAPISQNKMTQILRSNPKVSTVSINHTRRMMK